MKTKPQSSKQSDPIIKKEEVQTSNDEHIDQDFVGYPHLPAEENIINPKSKEDRVNAALPKKHKRAKKAGNKS